MNTTGGFCECGCGEKAPIAQQNNRFWGYRKGEPVRFIHGHMRLGPASLDLIRQSRLGKKASPATLARMRRSPKYRTHGRTNTTEYYIWTGMKQRCGNPNQSKWPLYGGRGIRVCDRWLNSFANFFADMGKRPSRGYSIDRIDGDGHYEPGNCRWATLKQQRANRPWRRSQISQ